MAQEAGKELRDGLKALADGSLLMLVSYIVLGLGFFMLPLLRFSMMPFRRVASSTPVQFTVYSGFAIAVVVLGVALTLYAVLGRLSSGLRLLSAWRGDLSGLSPLVVWGLGLGFILLGLGAMFFAFAWPGRWIILVLSFIALVVGYIGVGVTGLKLGTYLNSSTFTLGGAFALISSVLPLFAPVAWLIMYVEASGQSARVATHASV